MNLFKKTTASVALVALVSGIFSTGVSANSSTEIEAANALAEMNYINDHSDDTAAYNLNSNVLRQEIAAVARGIAGLDKKDTCDGSFSDVSETEPNDWACYSVEALLDADLINDNAMFNPENEISKAEAVGMMVKAAFGDTYAYDSDNSDSWQEQVVDFAVSQGIVGSFSNYDTAATRGFVFEVGNEAVIASEEVVEEECDIVQQLMGACDEDFEEEDEEDEEEEETVVVSGDNVLTVELSPETPNSGVVAENKPRTALLAFDVTAGSEDVTLDEVRLDYTGLSSYGDIDNVSMYIGNDEVSKSGKNFTDKYIEISFENDTVITAGSTITIVVTAEVDDSDTNSSHRITLTELTASSDVEMEDISSMSFAVVAATNVSALDLDIDVVSGADITIGEEIKLAEFELEEKSDNENVIVKSLTFQLDGSMDHEDDLSDIVLTIDGEEVATDLMVNSDEEIVVDLDYVIAADEKADFVLTAVVTGSVTEDLSVELTEVFAVGSETGVNSSIQDNGVAFDYANDGETAESRAIEGSEINVSFDKSDIDEARPDAEEVLVGTLKLSSDGAYTITRLQVTVETTGTGVESIVQKLELDGKSNDSDDEALATTTGVYYFDDISLNNETLELDLTFDVVDNVALDTTDVTFTAKIVEVEDEDNDESYDDGSTPNLDTILSTNSLDDNTIDIATANVTFTSTAINDRLVVLSNGVETVAYKGKINVGDADSITLTDLNFTKHTSSVLSGSVELDDLIDSATLTIGDQSFDADIDSDSVDFDTNLDIAAGADNVEILLSLVLKDNDSVNNNNILVLEVDQTALGNDIEDSDGNDVTPDITAIDTELASLELLDKGTLSIEVLNDVDTDDNLENTVLAGLDDVVLAEIDIEAEYEDVKIKELSFRIAGDFSSTLDEVRLMDGSTVLATASSVVYVGTGTVIKFENDFVIEDSSNLISAELVADLNRITGAGGVTSAISGDMVVTLVAADVDAKGDSSNDDLLTIDSSLSVTDSGAETVSVVPTKLVFSVEENLSTGTAKVKVTAVSGDNTVGTNDQMPEVVMADLVHTDLATGTGYTIYKEGNAAGQQSTFAALSLDDRTFDSSATYVFIPQDTVDITYTMVLSGDVSDYLVQDSDANPVATGLDTILDEDISVGTKSY